MQQACVDAASQRQELHDTWELRDTPHAHKTVTDDVARARLDTQILLKDNVECCHCPRGNEHGSHAVSTEQFLLPIPSLPPHIQVYKKIINILITK